MAARGRPVSSTKTRKVALKLQERIRNGEYYEAHQTYRVLYQRYKAQGKQKIALELLFEGASTLLQHSQWESGTDLAMLLITHLKENQTPVTDDMLDQISQLFYLYKPLLHSPSDIHPPTLQVVDKIDPRDFFMKAALKWSSMVEEEKYKYGHPYLHKLLALALWEEKQYARARDHFLYASQPEDFGAMLVEFATSLGYHGEADLFVTQAALQLMVLQNRLGAMGVFNVYTQSHPIFRDEAGPPYKKYPLVNFVWFLLLASEKGDVEVFKYLRENYQKAIARDPSFDEYLDKIGVSFFGMPSTQDTSTPNTGPGGLMGLLSGEGGLLQNLLGNFSESMPMPPFLQGMDGPPALPSTDQETQGADNSVTDSKQPSHVKQKLAQVDIDDSLD